VQPLELNQPDFLTRFSPGKGIIRKIEFNLIPSSTAIPNPRTVQLLIMVSHPTNGESFAEYVTSGFDLDICKCHVVFNDKDCGIKEIRFLKGTSAFTQGQGRCCLTGKFNCTVRGEQDFPRLFSRVTKYRNRGFILDTFRFDLIHLCQEQHAAFRNYILHEFRLAIASKVLRGRTTIAIRGVARKDTEAIMTNSGMDIPQTLQERAESVAYHRIFKKQMASAHKDFSPMETIITNNIMPFLTNKQDSFGEEHIMSSTDRWFEALRHPPGANTEGQQDTSMEIDDPPTTARPSTAEELQAQQPPRRSIFQCSAFRSRSTRPAPPSSAQEKIPQWLRDADISLPAYEEPLPEPGFTRSGKPYLTTDEITGDEADLDLSQDMLDGPDTYANRLGGVDVPGSLPVIADPCCTLDDFPAPDADNDSAREIPPHITLSFRSASAIPPGASIIFPAEALPSPRRSHRPVRPPSRLSPAHSPSSQTYD
jgi:hypothetical protein